MSGKITQFFRRGAFKGDKVSLDELMRRLSGLEDTLHVQFEDIKKVVDAKPDRDELQEGVFKK